MRIVTILTTTIFSVIASRAVAQNGPSIPLAAGSELTRPDLESWLDGLVPYAISTGDIAGGVVVVVKDGATLLQKGYGYADVASRQPVDAERTLFRAGSVGKLVTHTAIMQLIEQGKLDLDADIASYLDFPVAPGIDAPITLHNLMTHTAGFEELLRWLMAKDPQRLPPLDTYIRSISPPRIFAPGAIPSYCNYCVTLEGYIIQRVSGEAFDDYLDRHIFGPLEMRHSTFRQPLPPALAADMSKGYTVASEPARYFELLGPAPAGSLSTTAADMARFMLAHLSAQHDSEPGLLRRETAQLMHTRMFRVAPSGLGMAVGFFERDRNGRRIREHGGDTQFFHSQLALYIDDGVGLFMSFNSTGKDAATYKLRDALFEQFTDRYFPAQEPFEPTTATAKEHAQLLAGRYASSRRAETTFFRLFGLLDESSLEVNDDGTITLPWLTGLNDEPKRWREVGPFVWREVGGKDRLVAQVQDGRVRQISADPLAGAMTFLPVPASSSSVWILPTIALAIAALLMAVIAWPVGAIQRRRRSTPFSLSGTEAIAYQATRIGALVQLAFLLGWGFVFQATNDDLVVFDGRLDPWFVLLHSLGLVGVLGAAVAVWYVWLAFKTRRTWKVAVGRSVLAISLVAIVWFGFAFNLIRFTVDY